MRMETNCSIIWSFVHKPDKSRQPIRISVGNIDVIITSNKVLRFCQSQCNIPSSMNPNIIIWVDNQEKIICIFYKGFFIATIMDQKKAIWIFSTFFEIADSLQSELGSKIS